MKDSNVRPISVNDYFNKLQSQLSLKKERPARLELLIRDELNINKMVFYFFKRVNF